MDLGADIEAGLVCGINLLAGVDVEGQVFDPDFVVAVLARIRLTRNVTCIPMATESGGGWRSLAPAASENTAPITDAPVISPRLRERLSMPEVTPRWSARTPVITSVLLAVWKSA